MRHQLSGRQLSRNSSHRWAMLKNMAASLLLHETIQTTVPKAKELRRVVEPLITLGKTDSQANRRRAFSKLRSDELVTKLFEDLGPRFKARAGGYTRILKMDERPGDNAPMALMQLVDKKAEVQAATPEPEKKVEKKPKPAKKVAPKEEADEVKEKKPAAKKKATAKKTAAKKSAKK